ncbi:hypothetical protein RB195_013709 [Necator americanus]|uniref:N-Acetylglucosaminyltransferase-IV region n=1 Tax=Necator americanus TaxID=51031 RepID=A0ABR1DWU7_NECAM
MKTIARISVAVFAFLSSTVNIYMLVFMYEKEANGTRMGHEPLLTLQQRLSQNTRSGPVNVHTSFKNEESNEEPSPWYGILDFFPELCKLAQSDLEPIALTPRSRVRKKLMVGIPVAERAKDYSIATLSSLFEKLDNDYRKDIVFLIMFATMNTEYFERRADEIKKRFSNEISDGLLEMIAVAPAWYKTDILSIPATFNDSTDRMLWRTKQNIDYIYIMTYAIKRCEYYMQLEDDVEAAPAYARVIFNYLALNSGTEWLFMSFSSMGFIGRLFRSSNLKYMTYAIALYYRFKPVDWILEDILRSRYCSLDKNMRECAKEISAHRISSGTSQFQHVGKISSLRGKIQKIHDGNFNKGLSQGKRGNPSADVTTSMVAARKRQDPENAYNNNMAMWLINPQIGDYISIAFHSIMNITGVMFLSGVPPAPEDKFGPETIVSAYNGTSTEISLGQFSENGDFLFHSTGIIVKELRIKVTANISHWVTVDHIVVHAVPIVESSSRNITILG